jgi:hypothetical protein
MTDQTSSDMHRVRVQFWGGPHDGHNAQIVVGRFEGPPDTIWMPAAPVRVLPLVIATEEDRAEPVRRYWLDTLHDHRDHLLYRIEPEENA